MAIDDLLDEHEQSERVRGWLRNNGGGLVMGIALGLAAIGGWQWWQQRQTGERLAAAQQYDTLVHQVQANNVKQAQGTAATLAKSGNDYAALAAMQLAKKQVEAGETTAAIATLRAVHSKDPAISAVLQSRLARLLIDDGKPQDALTLLGDKPTGAAALEARGDALYALKRTDDARAAYTQALAKLDVAMPQRRVVELKLIQVGGNPTRPENRS
jgi:predicted negative regulator of RcsB-dependent stress response